jgi:hypothetical protein
MSTTIGSGRGRVKQRETGEISTELARRSKRVRLLGQLLDNSIPIPGTGRRIGLDAVIGLVPGVGDLIGGLLSGYIVLEAARAQVPTVTLVRMLGNVGIDTLLGVVPGLGDIFDAAWKANTKNVMLLQGHLVASEEPPAGVRSALGSSLLAIGVLALIVIGGIALTIYVARLLWGISTQ